MVCEGSLYPAAHVANEGENCERSACGSVVEDVRATWRIRAGRSREYARCAATGHRPSSRRMMATAVGDESGLEEGDGEADAPGVHGDVLAEQA